MALLVMTETAPGPHPAARLLAPGIAGVEVGRRIRRTGRAADLHRCRQLWRDNQSDTGDTVVSAPHRLPRGARSTTEVRNAPERPHSGEWASQQSARPTSVSSLIERSFGTHTRALSLDELLIADANVQLKR
jgi:hypothetical protein